MFPDNFVMMGGGGRGGSLSFVCQKYTASGKSASFPVSISGLAQDFLFLSDGSYV